MNNCCQETPVPSFNARLIGEILYISYNGNQITVPLDSIAGGEAIPIELKDVTIQINTDGQTYFPSAIPAGYKLSNFTVNGIIYSETTVDNPNGDYIIVGNNITWDGPFNLKTTHNVILKIWK